MARSISQEFTFRVLPVNQAPVWNSSPSPTFVQGTAAFFPASGTYQSNGYVTDPDGNPITITWLAGSVSGVTWDGGRFVYDGFGSLGTTGGLVLRASDGTAGTNSSAFSIQIASGLAWSATPSFSFVEAGTAPQNAGAFVTNYNASTDEFRVTPGFSLPSWLALTVGPGSGSGNLTPNGTQVDANDIPASPGIKIDVRRSGGAWVSSAAFGVTVLPVGTTFSEGALTSVPLEYMFPNSNNLDTTPSSGSWHNASGAPATWVHAVPTLWPSRMGNFFTNRDVSATQGSGAYAAWVAECITKQEDVTNMVQIATPFYGGFCQWMVDQDNFAIYYIPG